MNPLTKSLYEPIKSIKDRPFHFVTWWLVANVIGLAGFWLPLLVLYCTGKPSDLIFERLIQAGTLASFSIVILADGIATSLVTFGAGSNVTALGIRAVITILAIIIAIIQVAFIAAEHTQTGGVHVFISFHLVFTGLAILCATYLYCFRFPSWEKGLAEMSREEDQEVNNLAKEAESKSADAKGVKL
jgi:hypothetical protein